MCLCSDVLFSTWTVTFLVLFRVTDVLISTKWKKIEFSYKMTRHIIFLHFCDRLNGHIKSVCELSILVSWKHKNIFPPEQTSDMFKCDKLRYKSCLFHCKTFVELVSLLQSLARSSLDCFTWGFYPVCSNYKCMLLNTTKILFFQKQHVCLVHVLV